MSKAQNLILVGLMGSGKTSVGQYIARKLNLEFYDSDHEIEVRSGADIPWIFDLEGEAGFRKREAQVIEELTQLQGIVLATGGGVVLDPANRAALGAHGIVIYLHASVEHLVERTRLSRNRPLLLAQDPKEIFTKLTLEREHLYREIADFIYDTNGLAVPALGNTIINDLKNHGYFL